MNLKASLILTFSLFAFSQAFSQDTKTLDSSKYKINYPADWLPSYMSGYGAEMYIFTPTEDNTEFQENINLTIQKDVSEEMNDLETYTESVASSLETYIKELDIKTKEYNTSNILPYAIIEYSGLIYGEKTNFYQRIYLKNKLFYILTFTFKPDSDINYREKAIKAFDSFDIK